LTTGIEQNLKVIALDKEDMDTMNKMAASGRQHRFNVPLWGSDLGFPNWYGPGNKDAPPNARLLAGKA
jgi:glycerol 2-dehydrogenase (NADP+)